MKVKLGNKVILSRASLAKGIGTFLGLRFRKELKENEALIMDIGRESRFGSAIDMMFVFCKITAVWLDKNKKVVDARVAKPFFYYMPGKRARYVVETNVKNFRMFKIGQKLSFSS